MSSKSESSEAGFEPESKSKATHTVTGNFSIGPFLFQDGDELDLSTWNFPQSAIDAAIAREAIISLDPISTKRREIDREAIQLKEKAQVVFEGVEKMVNAEYLKGMAALFEKIPNPTDDRYLAAAGRLETTAQSQLNQAKDVQISKIKQIESDRLKKQAAVA